MSLTKSGGLGNPAIWPAPVFVLTLVLMSFFPCHILQHMRQVNNPPPAPPLRARAGG